MSERQVLRLRLAPVFMVASMLGFLLVSCDKPTASPNPSRAPAPGTRSATTIPSSPADWLITGRTRTIAHRGGTPGGTVEGCLRSLDAGITFLELDVRLTADGAAVILHDAWVDTTSWDAVSTKSLEQVRAMKIPTVAEILRAVGNRGVVLLELKVSDAWKAVLEDISKERAFNRAVVRATPDTLQLIRAANPRILLGTRATTSDAARLRNLGVVAFTPAFNNALSPELVRSLHAAGIAVWGTNTNDPKVWSQLIELGVDGIITDQPNDLQALRR
jgi:glycerophosphoryl diester phosphodiesterase